LGLGAPGVTSDDIAEYTYLGFSSPFAVDYPLIDVQLDPTFSAAGARRFRGYQTQSAGSYPAFDRFGRVARHTWVDGRATTSSCASPTVPPIVSEGYTFALASNVTSKRDLRPGQTLVPNDWEYEYDGLNRMTQARRGSFGGTSTLTPAPGSYQWKLDALG